MFKKVDSKMNLPKMEEEILKFWEENKIFEKSVEKEAPKGEYVFYDGPPFATGTPHYGHIVASLMKDVVPRYWTMKGYKVERKWGWDCHGLPIENIAEKELGIKRKKEIEEMGVEKFNEFCRSKVLKYVDEWKTVINRLGRWADMENSYKTMDLPFMESVWWVFKQLWEKGLIYEGYRSMYICTRCETTLSQSEIAEGYKDIKDLSVTVEFNLLDEKNTSILAWTTTPWTLIGNVALAVGEDITYVKIEKKDEGTGEIVSFILAKDRLEKVFGGDDYKIVSEFKGKDLIGKEYKPLFSYYQGKGLQNEENGWKIYPADFVTTEEGTGIVHIAPAFGEDDLQMGQKYKLPFIQHVGMDGIIKPDAVDFAGMSVKPEKDHQSTDVEMIKYLAKNNLLFAKEKYEHSYPHCWRCETPLINYATSSWFVNVTKIKKDLLENAKDINWIPEHIKEGRFGNWLEAARDWSISRQRYWASVMPIWKCDKCENIKIIGSVDEIGKQFGNPNKLFLVRHGEAENNVKNILSSFPEKNGNPLTDKGRKESNNLVEDLRVKNIDLIFSSPMQRAKETAEIIAKKLGLKINFDERLIELNLGRFDGKPAEEYKVAYPKGIHPMKMDENGVEGFQEERERVSSFLEEINQKYQKKNIVIVSHGDPIWVMKSICLGVSIENIKEVGYMFKKGGLFQTYSKPVDLHKHIIDKITFKCEKCEGTMKRIPDVLDTWFDSGSMPYAQAHYPFENKEKFEKGFPAQFIAEGIDQTRCWFYYLHVIAGAIKNSEAYRNVIVNGIVLAEDGKKMAKRLQNYPDPMDMFGKYGADAVRLYLLSSPVMAAENINFSEKEVVELTKGIFRMLWNSYSFFILYANIDGFVGNKDFCSLRAGKNSLDKWIVSELQILIKEVNASMKNYELNKTARLFPYFIDNLSNWYIRRSRKRFWKSENDADKKEAYETLYFVLVTLAKLMAPFTPFIAEEIYRNLTTSPQPSPYKGEGDNKNNPSPLQGEGGRRSDEVISVHLADFPTADEKLIDEKLNVEMQNVRNIISEGLQLRAKAGIKVRQPLGVSSIKYNVSSMELENIIKEELNVKKLVVNSKQEENIILDTNITEELKLEGQAREIIRYIQEMRKEAGYQVDNRIKIGYSGVSAVFEKFGDLIVKETLAEDLKSGSLENADLEKEFDLDSKKLKLQIKKFK